MFTLVSCSSRARGKNIANFFNTVPTGATIYSTSGENLGTTPVERSSFRKMCVNNRTVIVEKIGYMSVNYNLDCDQDADEVTLAELNTDQFKNQTFGTYYREINEFSTKLLELHYLVLSHDYEAAKLALQKFKVAYPNVVATYTMLAQIELEQGNLDVARAYLRAALRIDPKNNYSLELLATLETSIPSTEKISNGKVNKEESVKKSGKN
jgi:tetratricopeptide (TPR) repeat protein